VFNQLSYGLRDTLSISKRLFPTQFWNFVILIIQTICSTVKFNTSIKYWSKLGDEFRGELSDECLFCYRHKNRNKSHIFFEILSDDNCSSIHFRGIPFSGLRGKTFFKGGDEKKANGAEIENISKNCTQKHLESPFHKLNRLILMSRVSSTTQTSAAFRFSFEQGKFLPSYFPLPPLDFV
jgi:hypothetical protein